jgi:replicative DNA helicase
MTEQVYSESGPGPGRNNGQCQDRTGSAPDWTDLGVPRVTRLADLLDDLVADATAAHEALLTNTPRGPRTGLDGLDNLLGGVLSPGIHILHAAPGIGKTALALQIAAGAPFPSLYITAEMHPVELLRRHTARATKTFLGRLKSGELRPGDVLEKARTAAADAPLLSIADATRWPAPRAWIEATAAATFAGHRTGLLVVDSLQSWAEAFDGPTDEYTRLAAALKALRATASTLTCPILVISERNRTSMKDGGISAGAGHRGIEYGAETVMALDKDEKAGAAALGEHAISLSVVKNRNGACGKVHLIFNGALQTWRAA